MVIGHISSQPVIFLDSGEIFGQSNPYTKLQIIIELSSYDAIYFLIGKYVGDRKNTLEKFKNFI